MDSKLKLPVARTVHPGAGSFHVKTVPRHADGADDIRLGHVDAERLLLTDALGLAIDGDGTIVDAVCEAMQYLQSLTTLTAR